MAAVATPHMRGSVESALLLKIREAKHIRTDAAPASPAPSPSPRRVLMSPSHAKLKLRTSPVHAIRRSDASMSAHSIDLTTSSTAAARSLGSGRRLAVPRHEALDASEALQPPLEPPVPHRKPEKPLGAVPASPSRFRGAGSCSTQAAGTVENKVKTQLHQAIAATNAAAMIQRVWRRRRSIRQSQGTKHAARGSCSPVYTIVVDKEAAPIAAATGTALVKLAPLKSMQEEGASKGTSGQLHIDDEVSGQTSEYPESTEIALSESSTTNQAPLWSEDEWNFLEEGRSAGSALLDGKSEGARMDEDELVWKFPQRLILQREAQRLKTVQQAKNARKNTSDQRILPTVKATRSGASDATSGDQDSHPALPPRRCSTPTDMGKDQRIFRLRRHRKVVQSVHKKRQSTSKRVLVDHRRLRTDSRKCVSARAPLVAPTPSLSEGVAALTTPDNEREVAINCPVANDASPTAGLEVERPKSERGRDKNATAADFSQVYQFVEFASMSSVSHAEQSTRDAVVDSTGGSRNDLIYVGDLMVAGHLLLDAALDLQASSSQSVGPRNDSTADVIAELKARDIIPLSLSDLPATEYEHVAAAHHGADDDCRADDDEERVLDQKEVTTTTRPNESDPGSNGDGSGGFETDRQSPRQVDNRPLVSLADSSANAAVYIEADRLLADRTDTLETRCGGVSAVEIDTADPLHSLQELENTVAQTLNRIHNHKPSSISSGTSQKSYASSSSWQERFPVRTPSDNASVSSVTSFAGSSLDPREQQEFRQILDDFRNYLRLSAVDSNCYQDSKPSSSSRMSRSSWGGGSDRHIDEDVDATISARVRYDTDEDSELRVMASEIRQCRLRVAQSLLPWSGDY